MAGQKKWGKDGYLKNFEKSREGGYVYTGGLWQADNARRRTVLGKLWALCAGQLVAVLLPGFFTTAGFSGSFYVILPYVFWFLSDIVLTYTLGSITLGGNPMRDYIYQRSVTQYAHRTVFPLAGATLTALALLVFLLRGGSGEGAALCLICCVIQAAASVMAGRIRFLNIWKC